MTKPDIFAVPANPHLRPAPTGQRWVVSNLEPSNRHARAWHWTTNLDRSATAALADLKIAKANERFNEALDNMLVMAVEQGMDLAVSDWIHDDAGKTFRRDFALISPGAAELPFAPPVRIFQTSRGWPEGHDVV